MVVSDTWVPNKRLMDEHVECKKTEMGWSLSVPSNTRYSGCQLVVFSRQASSTAMAGAGPASSAAGAVGSSVSAFLHDEPDDEEDDSLFPQFASTYSGDRFSRYGGRSFSSGYGANAVSSDSASLASVDPRVRNTGIQGDDCLMWEFYVVSKKLSSPAALRFGVVSVDASRRPSGVGRVEHTYAMCGDGSLPKAGDERSFGTEKTFKAEVEAGCRVGVQLDLRRGHLLFFINGLCLGPTPQRLKNVDAEKVYLPALVLPTASSQGVTEVVFLGMKQGGDTLRCVGRVCSCVVTCFVFCFLLVVVVGGVSIHVFPL